VDGAWAREIINWSSGSQPFYIRVPSTTRFENFHVPLCLLGHNNHFFFWLSNMSALHVILHVFHLGTTQELHKPANIEFHFFLYKGGDFFYSRVTYELSAYHGLRDAEQEDWVGFKNCQSTTGVG